MSLQDNFENIRALMGAFRHGDSQAGAQLFELFYPELKRVAAGQLRAQPEGHSWQPTLLVHELYLQLMKIRELQAEEVERQNEKGAFFALAGQIMRRLLIHHSRPLANKAQKIPLWDGVSQVGDNGVLEVEDILARLAAVKPVLRTVVEMKVFHGMSAEEIGDRLGCATVTINRHWQFSRRWLREELTG